VGRTSSRRSGSIALQPTYNQSGPPTGISTRLGAPRTYSLRHWTEEPNFNISPDGHALTMLLEALDAVLSAAGPASVATVAAIEIPITLPDPLSEACLGHSVILHGFIDKPAGVHAAVHVDLGGATQTFEFSAESAVVRDLQFNMYRFSTPSPSDRLSITVLLTLNRNDSLHADGLLKLDTVDVEINKLEKIPDESAA